MTLAKHLGACLVVLTLVYAILVYSPRWPEVVVGIVGAFLFAAAELDELAGWLRHRRRASAFCVHCAVNIHGACQRPASRFPRTMTDERIAGMVQVCCCDKYHCADGTWYQLGALELEV